MTSQTPKETQDTDVEEVVEEVAGHLQHLLTIAEGKEEIEQWNTHAANLINAVTKVLHHQLQKAREKERAFILQELALRDIPDEDGGYPLYTARQISNYLKSEWRIKPIHSELDQEVSK